jgi:hypothetical protein
MDLVAFKASLAESVPPNGIARPLQALWWAAKDEWKKAHELVQAQEGERDHDRVHAYLHRVEGDLSNAGYWYRRAAAKPATGSLEAEWAALASEMLAR